MNFVDEAKIEVIAGNGGDGSNAFRREKYRPKGGPSGGDGGDGGSVIFYANSRNSTLQDFKYKRTYKASRGQDGMGKDMFGRGAEDLKIPVPIGTSIYDLDTDELIIDLTSEGQSFTIAKGGKGGLGNMNFATPGNQAPTEFEFGAPGTSRSIKLVLKLLADVGLLGLPNAGKSTLLSVVSAATPKIADYPFTTLIPNLGVVKASEDRSFVMADIPGLIEGASDGKGLGHRFLKHLERTAVLLHLVEYPLEGYDNDPLKEVEVLAKELSAFDPALSKLPRMIVMTKIDLCHDESELKLWEEKFAPHKFMAISSATRKGLDKLIQTIWKMVNPGTNEDDNY
jgi:GTPase